ncbi:MAG: AbrB/MazE/SpoVT family DNA-binding domain-containing protein [Alcaligenaceae bacterium]|jgi:antitoxin MazE|nr:AbrB/MazE/SpoVT family DNA-binding domain-containing protein [Alcaligenaceae bacterium]
MSEATLTKWGNATGLRIPQPFLKQLELQAGDKVNVTLKKEGLVISKIGPTLEDLLQGCNDSNRHEEFFKEPYGKEML